MMKILYIPTGNTFVLPDEEALRVMSSSRRDYKILEGGLQKEATEKLEPETVKELVMQKPEEVLEEEAKEEEKLDYETLKRHELVAVARRLNISVDSKDTKAILLEKIYNKIGK